MAIKFLIAAALAMLANGQSIIKNINKLTYPVNRIHEGDVVIFSSTVRHVPEIYTCPPTEPCHILCLESPPRPATANTMTTPVSSSCGNMIVVAGNVPELKIICLDNACQGLQLQSSAQKNTVECLGQGACLGAKIQCGSQTPNKYLHLPVPPNTMVEACIVTCSNGGCAGSANAGGLPGTHVRCTGAMQECLVKANSAIDAFNYGLPGAQQRGSFSGATMECNVHGPGSGICNLECSDAVGKRYCTGMDYMCRANPAKCVCTDYCTNNQACTAAKITPDCPKMKHLKHTIPTPSPTKVPTVNPTSNPTANPTGHPTITPTGHPTVAPTVAPTTNSTTNSTTP